MDFPRGTSGKEPACLKQADIRNAGSISGLGRSPRAGNDNLLQNSCLGNPLDTDAWWAIDHEVTKESDTT